MAIKNEATSKTKKQPFGKRRLAIIIAITTIITGLIFTTLKIQSFAEQQRSLGDLQFASQALKPVYDGLLADNKNDIQGTYYENRCTYSYRGSYAKSISCGPLGVIKIKSDTTISSAEKMITENTHQNIIFTGHEPKIQTWSTKPSVVMESDMFKSKEITCYVLWSQRDEEKVHVYTLGCRKQVPDFLPGYKIVE
jgi:hypothetical protein